MRQLFTTTPKRFDVVSGEVTVRIASTRNFGPDATYRNADDVERALHNGQLTPGIAGTYKLLLEKEWVYFLNVSDGRLCIEIQPSGGVMKLWTPTSDQLVEVCLVLGAGDSGDLGELPTVFIDGEDVGLQVREVAGAVFGATNWQEGFEEGIGIGFKDGFMTGLMAGDMAGFHRGARTATLPFVCDHEPSLGDLASFMRAGLEEQEEHDEEGTHNAGGPGFGRIETLEMVLDSPGLSGRPLGPLAEYPAADDDPVPSRLRGRLRRRG